MDERENAVGGQWTEVLLECRKHGMVYLKVGDEMKPTERIIKEVRQAVDLWPQFDRDEEVDGAELVEWFALWRRDVKHALNLLDNPPNAPKQNALALD